MKVIDQVLDQVASLPPLPDTAIKLMNVVSDPRSQLDDIVEAVRYDQAVTTEVLKLCNSAFFGLSRKVTSLNDAMLCLGTVKVMQLIMAVHTNSMLAREQNGYGLAPGVLWKHSVAVALASSTMAARLNLPNVNLAFTSGLLHDIGKVVLNEYVAQEYGRIVKLVTQQRMTFNEAEQEVLGTSHEDVGGKVAEAWQLPTSIVNCIQYHHHPDKLNPPDLLVDVVYLADCITMLFGVGLGDDGLSYRANENVMERNGLREHDLEAIGIQMLSELQRVGQAFGASPKLKTER